MSKITIISGYYYPEDTAVGLYNKQMVDYLEAKGNDITVITGFPNYPQWQIWDSYKNKPTFYKETINKTTVFRYKQYVPKVPSFLKRILLIIDFTFGGFINVLKIKECDLVISIVPYTSSTLLGWVLKKRTKAKFWNHIQDFEFDAALQAGISKQPGKIKRAIFKLLFGVENYLFNRADVNSTISHTMMHKLASKSKTKTFYFPNWIDPDKINPKNSETHEYLNSKKFKILYSGNIGDKQDWEFFIEFAKALNRLEVEIVVVGDGAKKEWLTNNITPLKNVTYYPPIKYKYLSNLLCSADLHILFQKNDVVDSVMPSKLLGMMASTKPSLITGGDASEVKEVIENSQGGFYVTNRNLKLCIEHVNMLISNPKVSIRMGEDANKYIVKNFSSKSVLQNFEETLMALLEN